MFGWRDSVLSFICCNELVYSNLSIIGLGGQAWTCPLGPKIMKIKTWEFGQVKVKCCDFPMKQNNSKDLLGYSFMNN